MTPCAVCQQSLAPLSLDEKRLIWEQLQELREARIKISAYEEFAAERERAAKLLEEAYQQKLEAAREQLAALEERRKLAEEKSAFYRQSYESCCKKKRSKWCTAKRVFTLGLARCR